MSGYSIRSESERGAPQRSRCFLFPPTGSAPPPPPVPFLLFFMGNGSDDTPNYSEGYLEEGSDSPSLSSRVIVATPRPPPDAALCQMAVDATELTD
ncbi:hypothetical protein EYF80_038758 [Liparis tanakae]|uniref:Uncharacterized protein n=1 Tax=Liparis tanakae TaxID=230148 RepID=A0A4Z2GBR4_9TELE|nr:hypothetical protein EYF80_038758 [Liparis tanakae]